MEMEIKFNQENFNSWYPRPGYNYAFLMQMQNLLNDMLTVRKVLTAYDALRELGMKEVPLESKAYGWIIGTGDGFLYLGVFPEDDLDLWRFGGSAINYLLRPNCELLENLVKEVLNK